MTKSDADRIVDALTRLADEIDQIDTRLMQLIEALSDSGLGIQASINDWVPD